MRTFFGNDLFLTTPAAKSLYESVRDLPIVDYHCHLNEKEIREDRTFSSLGELWLGGDHYKWRAMRLCGVEEKYVTGDAPYEEKYRKFAEIFPKLCGSPLYYWTQLELKLLFGITEPLNPESAERIRRSADEQLKTMHVSDILKKFRVEYVATTDDPVSPLSAHGTVGGVRVCPTFRPDRILSLDGEAIRELGEAAGTSVDRLDGLKEALIRRLDYFCAHGCRISDHGMDFLPVADCGEFRASELYARRERLGAEEKAELSAHLLSFLAGQYRARDMVMQLHFATFRNVNSAAFDAVGRDAGFDVMRDRADVDRLAGFFDALSKRDALPKTVVYSLNPGTVPALATLTGAFPSVRVGAAWWFNDTLSGIRRQLEVIAEYTVLGTHLGMLTDSRSFASYARFDFFRRILSEFVGGYVERGEYDPEAAKQLMYDVCLGNVKTFLGV